MSTKTIAFIGQSNMQGQGDSTISPTPETAIAQEWIFTPSQTGGTGYWTTLVDPVSRNMIASTMKANTGSLVPAFCNAYHAATGNEVNVIHHAVSGSSLVQQPLTTTASSQNWSLTGTTYPLPDGTTQNAYGKIRPAFKLRVNKCLENLGNVPLDMIVIFLGETDGLFTERYKTTFALYPNGMVTPAFPLGYSNPSNLPSMYQFYVDFIGWLQTQWPGVQILILQTGIWHMKKENGILTPYTGATGSIDHYNGSFNIQKIQQELATNLTGVSICTGQSLFGISKMKLDGVHYNQVGLDDVGTRAGNQAATIIP
jgi:Carbohydrate esterase, sialic acid-specific acetylesterase